MFRDKLLINLIIMQEEFADYPFIADYIQDKKFTTDFVKNAIEDAKITPGESVGVLAAQSISETLTQSTLNYFHTLSSSKVGGITRITQLLNISKPDQNNHHITVFPKPTLNEREIRALAKKIQGSSLEEASNFFSAEKSFHKDDYAWVRQYAMLMGKPIPDNELPRFDHFWVPSDVSSCCIRIVLDKKKIGTMRIDQEDLAQMIENDLDVKCLASSPWDHLSPCVIYICPIVKDFHITEQFIKDHLSLFMNYFIPLGMENVKKIDIVPFTSYTKDGKIEGERFKMILNGGNITDTFMFDQLEHHLTTSDDPLIMLQTFGIEAARRIWLNEFQETLGMTAYVNPRHSQLLVDTMTLDGDFQPVNRNGIPKKGEVIERASFEEQAKNLIMGSLNNEKDAIRGISTQIALGKRVTIGTNMFSTLVDFDKYNEMPEEKEEIFVPSY